MTKIQNLKKSFFVLLFLFSIFYFLFSISTGALAQDWNQGLNQFQTQTGLGNQDLATTIGRIVQIVIGFLGLIAVIIIVVGGFMWMTSSGAQDKIDKAKALIKAGVIGMIIIVLSFAAATFIMSLLKKVGGGGDGSGGSGGQGNLPSEGKDYLVITSKYPRAGDEVPKNTSITIAFNQNLNCETIKLCTGINTPAGCTVSIKQGANFKNGTLKVEGNTIVFKSDTACTGTSLEALSCQANNSCPLNGQVPENVCAVGIDADKKCESLPQHDPSYQAMSCCRSGAFCCNCFAPGSYTVELSGGENGLKSLNGKYLKNNSNSWDFVVADRIDNTPPEVIVNLPTGSAVPINVGIAVIFSKPIDPSTLKVYDQQQVNDINQATIQIKSNDQPVSGYLERITDTSFIFRPTQACLAPNTQCRCFDKNAIISVELKNTAILGIRDTNCNLLKCDNEKCVWSFTTSDAMDTTPPVVKNTNPQNNDVNVSRLSNIGSIFEDKDDNGDPTYSMDPTSVNYDTFQLNNTLAQEIKATTAFQYTLKPYSVLNASQKYNATIFGGGSPDGSCSTDSGLLWGVKDLAGNAMVDNYNWSFTTGDVVNNGLPYIDSVTPGAGANGQCITIHGYNLGCSQIWLSDSSNLKSAQTGQWDKATGTCLTKVNIGTITFYRATGQWEKLNTNDILKWEEKGPRPTTIEKLKNYSPENEIIIASPEGGATNPLNEKEIRVYPAQGETVCTDINYAGQTYNVFLIGDQCWFKQNLNVGTMTMGVNNQGIGCDSIQKYCYNNDEASCTSDGALYQWNQAMCGSTTVGARGICPIGWHIPTHNEWTTLERSVCTSGTCLTDFPYDTVTSGVRGTNEGTTLKSRTGFAVIMTGVRSLNGTFAGKITNPKTYFWSSTQIGSYIWDRNLYENNTTIYRWNDDDRMLGFSVRCIKDVLKEIEINYQN